MLFNYVHCSWIIPRSAWITPANAIQNMIPSEFDHQDSEDRERSRSPRGRDLEHQDSDMTLTGLDTPTSQISDLVDGSWHESVANTPPYGPSPRSPSSVSWVDVEGGDMVPVTPPTPLGGFPDAPQPWFDAPRQPWFVPRTPPELLMMTSTAPRTPESQ